MGKKNPQIAPSPSDFVTLLEQDQATATLYSITYTILQQ